MNLANNLAKIHAVWSLGFSSWYNHHSNVAPEVVGFISWLSHVLPHVNPKSNIN